MYAYFNCRLPEKLVVTWPDGYEIKQSERKPAGSTVGEIISLVYDIIGRSTRLNAPEFFANATYF